jgi:hypothetical protein
MSPESARPLCGPWDGTPSAGREQGQAHLEQETPTEATDSPPDAATRLVAYKADCGTAEITCPRQSTVSFVDQATGLSHLVRIVCKSWSCAYCGIVKRAQLAADVKIAAPNRFVTLTTTGHDVRTPRETFDATRRQISELAKLYRREGRSFEYLRVIETHESGYPHFHLLVRSPWLDKQELSHRWCHFTQAFIVDIRKVSNDDRGIQYVMKYLGKQNSVPFTKRRLSWTRNFFPKKPPDPESPYIAEDVQRWSGTMDQIENNQFSDYEWTKPNRWHWIGHHIGQGIVRPPSQHPDPSWTSLSVDPFDLQSALQGIPL